MTNIVESRKAEILKLHGELKGLVKRTLGTVVRLGQLLTEQKATLPHGQFAKWVDANLPFTDRTARTYMKVYHNRNIIKTERVSDLTAAYRLLAAPKGEVQVGKHRTINISEINPNPFFDLTKVAGTRVALWVNTISEAKELWDYPDSVMVVRQQGDKYELACGHDQWSALNILRRDVLVSVVNLTDEQMKDCLCFERTDEILLGDTMEPVLELER